MNQPRRKKLETLKDQLDDIISEEQEAFDNMPESIQDSEKGQTMEEGIDNLQEALDLLETILS